MTKSDILIAGGKAANLGELLKNNFPVPNGFILTTKAYSQFLNDNNIRDIITDALVSVDYDKPETIDECSRIIQDVIINSKLSSSLIRECSVMYQQLPSKKVAVRSSATAEDLPDFSFAGQQDTYLNVQGMEAIIRCVKKCYASLWSARVISYRHRNQVSHSIVELAVVIQIMVPALSAGVLFTANPISLNPTEMVIESNFGLGESIVSGRTVPDQFTVARTGDEKNELFRIISRKISQKDIITQIASSEESSGIEIVDLSETRSRESSLTDDQIYELVNISRRIEKSFGVPQDIEWAIDDKGIVFILQSRPITSLIEVPTEDEILWTRGYADDYWNDPVTPLFFDLLGDHLTLIVNNELNSIMGYPVMGPLLKLRRNHAYFNVSILKRKVEYEIPSFLRNDDLLNYFPTGSGPFGKETVFNLPFHLKKRIIAEIRVMLLDPSGSITKTAKEYDQWTEEMFLPFCEKFDEKLEEAGSLPELLHLAKVLNHSMIPHFKLVRYSIPVHNIGMNLAAQFLLEKFVGSEMEQKYYPVLISSEKTKTSDTNSYIHDLAKIARNNSKLRDLILERPSEDLHDHLTSLDFEEAIKFVRMFNDFLIEFGDRGFTREPFYPRWRDEPKYIFDILKSLIVDHPKMDFAELEAKNLRRVKQVEKFIEFKLGLWKWKVFKTILGFARIYIKNREAQRFVLDKWITRNRNLYREIGKEFVSLGILNETREIFFLHKKEINKIVNRKKDFTEGEKVKISTLVKNRYEEFLKHEHTTPPKFVQGSLEFNDPDIVMDDSQFKGIPASQGIVTGLIRVLTDIRAISQVRAGEILVVPKTDPGWTPIFSKIGGLITETGGILSHGAVVSREYNIPATTNIRNACQIFKTGMKVTINGNNGLVKIEK